jgi:hypothetical protein
MGIGIDIPDEVLDSQRAPAPMEVGGRLLTQAVRRAQLARLAIRGVNAKRAAEILGCSHAVVREVYSDPSFRRGVVGRVDDAFADTDEAFAAKKRTLVERVEEKAEVAFEILCAMLEDDKTTPGHRIRIAQDLLDRHAETAPINRQHFKIDPLELSRAARVAQEMDNERVIEMPRARLLSTGS